MFKIACFKILIYFFTYEAEIYSRDKPKKLNHFIYFYAFLLTR